MCANEHLVWAGKNQKIMRSIRVAICISTFRRQKLLRELLIGIGKLSFRKVAAPDIETIVVDTPDQSGSAREVCENVDLPWPVKYVVEPRRGLTFARNRAIAEAGPADFIASIDDDEVPSAAWLDEMLWTQSRFSADVVSGPVLPKFAQGVPDWIQAGGFFDPRVTASTGTQQSIAATHNALIATHVFTKVPGFDDAYTLSGAEDTEFFLQASRAGYKIVWSQEAVVFEHISAKRGSVGWILAREYQTGNGWVFCEASMDRRLRKRAARFLKAWGHVVIGSARTICSALLFDRVAVIHALQQASLGGGMLAALAGHRFLAYRTQRIQPLETHNSVVQTPSEALGVGPKDGIGQPAVK